MPPSRLGRLHKGEEFDSVYREGIVCHGPLFVVRARRNATGTARWGFAVGKRIWPHAVDRNRVKRRLREAARSLEPVPTFDLVVTARPGASGASFADTRVRLAALLAEAAQRLGA